MSSMGDVLVEEEQRLADKKEEGRDGERLMARSPPMDSIPGATVT